MRPSRRARLRVESRLLTCSGGLANLLEATDQRGHGEIEHLAIAVDELAGLDGLHDARELLAREARE